MSAGNARKKLLTIDDEAGLRRSIQLFFEDSGFIVLQADSGERGLQVFQQERPDIVLVDLRMPGMAGLDVIKVISKQAPEVPVVVVSGAGMVEDAIAAIRAGAVDYVTKPVTDLLVLEHTVHKALEKAELVAENQMYQENLEELVESRTAQLRQAQKMEAIGTLAGGIAHDFNNILTAIVGYNELALFSCRDEQMRGFLSEVQQGAERAGDLVQQILTFSRKGEQEQQSLEMALVVSEAVKLIRSTIPPAIEVKQAITSRARVLADPTMVHQIVMNLCTNAYHAMPQGGELLVSLDDIQVSPAQDLLGVDLPPGHYLHLQVSDTGCGMDRQTLERIFDPYFTTKAAGSGTGLGLAVVHGIVGSYGGEVKVISEPGQGTTFHVFLSAATDLARPTPLMEAAPPLAMTGEERILFVDDEPAIVDLAREALSNYGYKVSAFTDSSAALAVFTANPGAFAMVITDMAMPKMNGDELSRKILALRPELPIILCTGFSELLNRDRALAIGIRRYVQKPVAMSELVRLMRELFDLEGEFCC
ncbi:MAG: response regulator [Thermodesulfobacteriota bacterium]